MAGDDYRSNSPSNMGPHNRRIKVGGPDGHENLPGPIDRAGYLQAQLDEANELLIGAILRLHGYVPHEGTRFDDRALAHFDVPPPKSGGGYRDAWAALAEDLPSR